MANLNGGYDDANAVQPTGLTPERAAAILIIGALVFLIMISRGFRGVNVGGVSVGVR
jgi:hypothetical protein